jgi:hypothetical protein
MSKTLSVSEILANLEARLSNHRERRELHARQEAHHREQCTFHDAELAKIQERYDAFKAAAEAASDYAHPPETADGNLGPAEDDLPRFGNRLRVSGLIARVVETLPEGEPFGAHAVAAEVNQRYGDRLDKPVRPAAVSAVLRRLGRARKIRQVRRGKAAHEGLYVRGEM